LNARANLTSSNQNFALENRTIDYATIWDQNAGENRVIHSIGSIQKNESENLNDMPVEMVISRMHMRAAIFELFSVK